MGISAITPDAASADFQAAPSGSSALGGDTAASNAPQTPSQQSPAAGDASSPVGGANAQPPQGPHQSLMADIVKAVGHILGGPTDMQSVDPNTGQITHVPLSRSARIANAASMALRGAAAGAAQRGPGATGRAAAAGVQAGTEAAQQQQQNVLAQSKNQQGVLAAQGAHALQQQQMAEIAWRMSREQTSLDEATADKLNAYKQMVASDPSNKDWGQYSSFDDFVKSHGDLQQQGINLAQLQAQGKLVAVPTTTGGKISGVHIFQIGPDWAKQKNSAPISLKRAAGLDDKGNVQYDTMTVPAGAVDNTSMLNYFNSSAKDSMDAAEASIRAKGEKQEQAEKAAKLPGELAEQQATIEHTHAETNQLSNLGGTDAFGMTTGRTPEGQVLPVKEYNSRADKFAKDYVQPLGTLQKTVDEFDRINNDPNQTGAEKVTALLNAVGISGDPLKGKGFRINNQIINEHAEARNIWEAGVQKLNTIVGSGGPVTSQQIKDYTAVAQGVVHDAYVSAAQEARRQGLPVNFLPKAAKMGSVATPFVAKIYLDSAQGDKNAAYKALQAAGYK